MNANTRAYWESVLKAEGISDDFRDMIVAMLSTEEK